MSMHDKVSTGLEGLDHIIDKLRLGDNVVWQVDAHSIYYLPDTDQAKAVSFRGYPQWCCRCGHFA